MKKIINGKLYDTDTAKELGSWSKGEGGDFSRIGETLYRKRTGEFFLYGEGGPMTQYAESRGDNSWSGGEKIIPLSVSMAREWAEVKLDADRYARIFGMPDEGAGKVTLCVQLPADLDALIRARASEAGQSITAYVERILRGSVD